jgi:methyl acetate hydrolase
MDYLSALLSEAVSSQRAPFVVGMLATSKGICWTGASNESIAGVELNETTVFRIVSMSKAIGATAAALLAERGKLDWDIPAEQVLPAFGDLQVLDSRLDGSLRTRPARTKATLRQLATHTSGLVYSYWDANIARYLHKTGLPPVASGRRASLRCPLAFDPGARWHYGSGVDWLGLAVEAIDGRSIDKFCRQEIFDPLRMNDTRFELEEDMMDRIPPAFGRTEDNGFCEAPFNVDPPPHPEFYAMGSALYSTPADYMRFLRMLLNGGRLEGIRLLTAESVTSFLSNQIGDLRLQSLQSALPVAVHDLVPPFGVAASHSLGFARTEQDIPGMRSKGSQFWAGVLNTHCWLDPGRDFAGIFMTQLLPLLDPGFMSLFEDFERTAYAHKADLGC